MAKLKKIRKAEIHWIDSTQSNQVWWDIEEYMSNMKKSQEVFISVGYIIDKGKKKIVLATSIHIDDDGDVNRAGTIFTIPLGCITKIKYL